MAKWNAGVWAGIILLLFSIIIFVQSFAYSYASDVGPGPGFFPSWLSGLLVILSIFYIIESFKGKSVSNEKWPKGKAVKNILYILVGLFAFVILFLLFGFIVSGSVFLFLMFFKAYKWYVNILISISVSLFLFWLFNDVLSVQLPVSGILF